MDNLKKHCLGILAYGSLINQPGEEIAKIEIKRIKCETPFNVEYARTSATRNNAPTLIPVQNRSNSVIAEIIVLSDDIDVEVAKSILWRRETHKVNSNETYKHSDNPSNNKVVVDVLSDFMNIQNVLYTSIGSNIQKPITGELLADFAIASILDDVGESKKDGIRYLLDNKNNGIKTELSNEYERQILLKTATKSLEEAIEKLDKQRNQKA